MILNCGEKNSVQTNSKRVTIAITESAEEITRNSLALGASATKSRHKSTKVKELPILKVEKQSILELKDP